MRNKVAKEIRRAAEAATIGKPLATTTRLYRQNKKKYLRDKRLNNGNEKSSSS